MSPRARTILIVAILAIAAFAGGYLVATASDDDDAAVQTPGPTTTAPSTPPPASSTTSTSVTPAPTPTADPDLLDDGLHFIKVTGYEADRGGSPALRFDLATLYTGADAYAYAKAHDIEMTNDYVIANDNPRLRWMPLAHDVAIEYIPEGTCCTTHAGTLDGFEAAVNAIAMTDYPSMDTTWWFLTVADGRITKIVQQYFP
jgi:hypothetical protein